MKLRTLHPLHADALPPQQFTYPFCYEPHPLCVEAAHRVRRYVQTHEALLADAEHGKMFGVLVVKAPADAEGSQPDGGLRFLAAYSGLLAGRNDWSWFVPPVFDAQQPDGYFKQKERDISALNQFIDHLELQHPRLEVLKNIRREASENLQEWLFRQYRMLNARGEERDLIEIWRDYHSVKTRRQFPYPPGGAGDCCAPKLLQYAYQQGLQPVCMAEFWMGESPRGEVRHAGQFYPACRGKFLPILTWMLQGLDVKPNPQENDPLLFPLTTAPQQLDIVYEDQWLLVIDKPSGLLSVPGHESRHSVWSIVRRHYPDSYDWMLAHRLDMGTSGLLVIAKSRAVYQQLQAQFMNREVRKTYVAVLDGVYTGPAKGTITLPLRADPLDRPRQVVDEEGGKPAVTDYQVVGQTDGLTRLELHPHTGRTHQLRVHCAHQRGLGIPIKGDDLYGLRGERLLLHARDITFVHPVTGQEMTFHSEPKF